MGFLPLRCCCKAVYELWPSLHGDGTFGIINLVNLVGEPDNTAGEFEITDVIDDTWIAAMAIDDVVYLIEQDDPTTPTTIYVDQYDNDSDTHNWGETSSNTVSASPARGYGYWVWGINGSSNGVQFCCNPTQVYSISTDELFSDGSVTSTVAMATTEGGVIRDGDSRVWWPHLLSSHDFPKCLASRTYYENDAGTYDSVDGPFTPGPFGTTGYPNPYWVHTFTSVTWDEVYEIAVADFDYTTTGRTSNEDIIYTKTYQHSLASYGAIHNSATAPSSPLSSSHINNVTGQPHWSRPPSNLLFSSYDYEGDGGYIATFRLTQTDGVFFPGPSVVSYQAVVVVNGATPIDTLYSGGTLNDYETFNTCAYVHSTPTESGYAHALLTWNDTSFNYHMTGYSSGGTEEWDHDLESLGRIRSVSDHYFWLQAAWDMANDAPDGRNWSNAEYDDATTDEIWNWMVRLDGDEWEPIRDEQDADTWDRQLVYLEGGAPGGIANVNATSRDLVKKSSHPYGPPLNSYGTTPP